MYSFGAEYAILLIEKKSILKEFSTSHRALYSYRAQVYRKSRSNCASYLTFGILLDFAQVQLGRTVQMPSFAPLCIVVEFPIQS